MTHQDPSLGRNRSGMQMSPILSKAMIDNLDSYPWESRKESEIDPERTERESLQSSQPIGSIPLPLSLKGLVLSGIDMLKGMHPEVWFDKLGERLAFERQGVRLYEALLRKCMAEKSLPVGIDVIQLERIKNEELEHMLLIRDHITELGGDPTAQTPAADAVGVSSQGLLQVISDPRTSFAQCLEAILTAELADREGWGLLIELTRGMNEEERARAFEGAEIKEEEHVLLIRQMLRTLTLHEAGIKSIQM